MMARSFVGRWKSRSRVEDALDRRRGLGVRCWRWRFSGDDADHPGWHHRSACARRFPSRPANPHLRIQADRERCFAGSSLSSWSKPWPVCNRSAPSRRSAVLSRIRRMNTPGSRSCRATKVTLRTAMGAMEAGGMILRGGFWWNVERSHADRSSSGAVGQFNPPDREGGVAAP